MNEIVAAPLSQIRSQRIRWLWEPFIPRGKLALLDGDPGIGKSLIALDIAARLSRGGSLPNGKPAGQPHTTLILAAEDDSADTTRPRAEAAGADLERLIVPTGLATHCMEFPAAIQNLAKLLRTHKPDLLVIDPIVAFLSRKAAANSDQCVRHVLNLLAILAEKADCAILMIRHLRKAGSTKALYRGSGSIGFIASARTGLYAARHPSEPDLGVLAVTKSNLAESPPSLSYRIKSSESGLPVIEWLDAVDVDANELCKRPTEPLRSRDRAITWLREQLSGGPRKSAEILAAAAESGIPERTLLRAKADMSACSHQVHWKSGEREWYWYDPAVPWPKAAPFKKPFELPPLPPLDGYDD